MESNIPYSPLKMFVTEALQAKDKTIEDIIENIPLITETESKANSWYIKGWGEARLEQLNLNYEYQKKMKSNL